MSEASLPAASAPRSKPPAGAEGRTTPTPFLLDFFPLEGPEQTRLAPFYAALGEGRLTTTRCRSDGSVHWPPRVVCPSCHREELEWFDLPREGTIYAFSTVLVGAPMGMEADLPFCVGLVDLDGASLRLFTRIEGPTSPGPSIGERVRFEPFRLSDGRMFYRFRRAAEPSHGGGAAETAGNPAAHR
ncbi:MAG: Zn-ribbon domain-containing OB-fold protein [Thermoplasmata archaeon]